MFGLLKKNKENGPEDLAALQQKRDWAGLAKAYYKMGTQAMSAGDLNHAQLWLHRADTIYSSDDGIMMLLGKS